MRQDLKEYDSKDFDTTYDELSNLATDTDNMVKSDGTTREKLDFVTVAKNEFGDLISNDGYTVPGYTNIDDVSVMDNGGGSRIPMMIRLKTDVDFDHHFSGTISNGEMAVKDAKDLTYEEQKKLIDLIRRIIAPLKGIKEHCPEFDFKVGLHQYYNDLHIEVFVDDYVAAPALEKWPTIIMDYDRPQWLKGIRDDLVKATTRDLEAEKEKAKKAYERQLAKMEKQHQANVADLELFDKLNLLPKGDA